MRRDIELQRHGVPVESPELVSVQPQGEPLHRHVRDSLTEIVPSKLGILPLRQSFEVDHRQVDHQQRRIRHPHRGTARQMRDDPGMHLVTPHAGDEPPRLRIPCRRRPPCSVQQSVQLSRTHGSRRIELNRAEPCGKCRMELRVQFRSSRRLTSGHPTIIRHRDTSRRSSCHALPHSTDTLGRSDRHDRTGDPITPDLRNPARPTKRQRRASPPRETRRRRRTSSVFTQPQREAPRSSKRRT